MEIKEKEEVIQQQYLTFFVADEEYAINIQRVKEIIEYTTVTKVPKVPEWIRGVINLRGNVVPVVDLTVRFGLKERPVSKTTCIVIVEIEQDSERAVMGVIADSGPRGGIVPFVPAPRPPRIRNPVGRQDPRIVGQLFMEDIPRPGIDFLPFLLRARKGRSPRNGANNHQKMNTS